MGICTRVLDMKARIGKVTNSKDEKNSPISAELGSVSTRFGHFLAEFGPVFVELSLIVNFKYYV